MLAPNGGTVLVGKDTRLSGYMFESALEAGFVAAGVNVMLIGPLPTPGIAYLTKRFECDFGVVISASHNLYDDNGIKFFDGNGGKLSDAIEARIEKHLDEPPVTRASASLGRATRVDKIAHALSGVLRFDAFRVSISADSRSSSIAPMVLATRWGRESSPISAPRSCRSAVRRTVAISISSADRPRLNCCS